MNEFAFMVYMQKIFRAITTQRDISHQERIEGLNKFNEYVDGRMKREENPIYLHIIGDLLDLNLNKRGTTSQALRNTYNNAVEKIFSQDIDGMRAEYRDMSLYRFCQVIRGIRNYRTFNSTITFANNLLNNEDEPKHVQSLMRLLRKMNDMPSNSWN